MKRKNNLFSQIVDYSNIRLAFLKAIKGNRSSQSVIKFCKNTSKNLEVLRNKIYTLNCDWGNYQSFFISDPKLRKISTAPIEQRIMHHAIMNIIAPILERPLIYHTYACRKNKGTHAALLYAFHQCKSHPYFLKLDIRKYFDSIDHNILKTQLRHLMKDSRVLFLLDGDIDSYKTNSGKGVPIGNLTSQFFANLYLSNMDHYILENLHPVAYCRYMDDFVLWSSSQIELKKMHEHIENYTNQELFLSLKQSVFGKTASGLPFLGFMIKDTGILLLKISKKRTIKRTREITSLLRYNLISEEKAAQRIQSTFSAMKIARTNRFREVLCSKGKWL
jgi:retron-type reverse transcriptase